MDRHPAVPAGGQDGQIGLPRAFRQGILDLIAAVRPVREAALDLGEQKAHTRR